MAAETREALGFERSPRQPLSSSTSKRSSTGSRPLRVNVAAADDMEETVLTAVTVQREQRSASTARQSVQNEAPITARHRDDTSTTPRKPTVLQGADGKPLPILKGNRQFGYAQARRLAEQLRVKFAVDRNETRFYCPDSNEHTEPPPAHAELKLAVRGFLKASRKVVQESQELSQTAEQQVLESHNIEEQLTAMTQEYVERLQRPKPVQQKVIVTQAVQPQRRRLCCGGGQPVLP